MPGLDDLVHMHTAFADAGIKLMVVVPSALPHAQDIVEVLGLPYPLYTDPDYALFTAFGTGFVCGPPMPAWVVVDGAGVVRYFWSAVTALKAAGQFLPHYPEGDEVLELAKKSLGASS